MDRRQLESAGADYPYLQGLWTIPLGIGMIVAGISNLQSRPTGIGAIVAHPRRPGDRRSEPPC